MTTRPVAVRVSQATRLTGSSRRQASRMASEIWSAILSGWPSVTDSEVNKKRFLDGNDYLLRLHWAGGPQGKSLTRLVQRGCRLTSGDPTGRDRRGALGGRPSKRLAERGWGRNDFGCKWKRES